MNPFTFHDVEQNSPEWDALRLAKPTASGYAKFMANYGKPFGEPAQRYALQIALEKVTAARLNTASRTNIWRWVTNWSLSRKWPMKRPRFAK